MRTLPNPNTTHPVPGFPVTYVKPTITRPNTIVVGNPAKAVRKRFDDELIALLQEFRWWDKAISEIQKLIPLLHDNDLGRVKREIERRLAK